MRFWFILWNFPNGVPHLLFFQIIVFFESYRSSLSFPQHSFDNLCLILFSKLHRYFLMSFTALLSLTKNDSEIDIFENVLPDTTSIFSTYNSEGYLQLFTCPRTFTICDFNVKYRPPVFCSMFSTNKIPGTAHKIIWKTNLFPSTVLI